VSFRPRFAGALSLAVCLALVGISSPAAFCQRADAAPQETLGRRIGFYQWRGVAPAGEDLLTQARLRATAAGARLFRLYLGGRFDYVHSVLSPRRFAGDGIAENTTLAGILALPRYRAVLEDDALETVVLTAYAVQDYGAGPDDLNLLRPWGAREETAERRQITELCEWLYNEFGSQPKTVILSNHEADEKLLEIANYTGSPEMAVDTLGRWTRARFESVEAARRRHPDARLRILHALEISLVNLLVRRHRDGYRKAPPGGLQAEGWSALQDVVPHVSFDLISYSAYESVNSPYLTQNTDYPPEQAAERLERDLERIRETAGRSLSREGRKQFGSRFVMIGELGFARERFEHLATGGVLPRLYFSLRAAIGWGCPYVVLWQVFDHPRDGGSAWGFGLLDRSGNAPRLQAPAGGCDSVEACLRLLFDQGFQGWAGKNGYVKR
jgi:hypothetical protein